MAAGGKKTKKNTAHKRPYKSTVEKKNIISEEVGNYEKHPFFIKKANAARQLLEKIGLPKQLKVKTS